jgi:hypothetical protein
MCFILPPRLVSARRVNTPHGRVSGSTRPDPNVAASPSAIPALTLPAVHRLDPSRRRDISRSLERLETGLAQGVRILVGRDRDRAGKRVPRPKRRRYTPRGRARAQGSRRRCARGRGRERLLPRRSSSFPRCVSSSTLVFDSRKTHTTDVSRPPFPLARRIARRRVRRAHARLPVPDALGVRARGHGPSNTGRHRGRHAVARRSRRRASPRTRLFFGKRKSLVKKKRKRVFGNDGNDDTYAIRASLRVRRHSPASRSERRRVVA